MKKKGFTLIELLATIIILAAIALIVTPIIISVIKDSKKGAFETSANNIIYEANVAFNAIQLTDNPEATIYTFLNGVETRETGNITLDYRGNIPQRGALSINANGDVALVVYDGTYCATKTYDSSDVIVEEKALEDCDFVNYDPYAPVLVQGLIPVYYDETDMVWKKASKSNLDNIWYDYTNFKWANAVTVTEATRSSYMSASSGTAIPMADINTMFVWIPRYKYRIPAGTGPREIDVVFETKDTAKSAGDAISNYLTHPAFTFGTNELSGIWTGKFEATGTTASITVKPDLASIGSRTTREFYEAILTMNNNSAYGFSTDSNAHMIKSTEWGAVTYLYHSKYGKYGNPDYIGSNKELYKNNSLIHYTGRSMGTIAGSGILTPTNEYIANGYYTYDGKCATINASLPSPCNAGATGQLLPDRKLAYGASTTGNIYGVYDMSGGSEEKTMAVYMPNPIPATGISDGSGYSTLTTNSQYDLFNISDPRYYDRYLTTGDYKKGEATNETSGWYSDTSFGFAFGVWLSRGGYYASGSAGGSFYFYGRSGGASGEWATRIILVEE